MDIFHDDVAVDELAFSSGIDATSFDGGVVGDDASAKLRRGVVIGVDASAFGGCGVVGDDAVGEGGAVTIAKSRSHGGVVMDDLAVVQEDGAAVAGGVDVDAASEAFSTVVFKDAVVQGDIAVDIDAASRAGMAVPEGEAVPKGLVGGVEQFFLVQDALHALAVKDAGVVDEVALAEVIVGTLVAVETAVDLVFGGDVESVLRVGVVAVIGAFLDPDTVLAAAGEIGGISEMMGGLLPGGAVSLAVGADIDDTVFVRTDVHRDDVEHRRLVAAVAVDVVEGVVGVARSAPSEVEVEEVVVVIAVADEGVPGRTGTA